MPTTAYIGLAANTEGVPNSLNTELFQVKGYARQRVVFDENGYSINDVQFLLDDKTKVEILGVFAELTDVELSGHQRVYPVFYATPTTNLFILRAGKIRIFPPPVSLPPSEGAGALSVAFNGSVLGDAAVLNFSGAQVDVTMSNGTANIVIPPTPFSINSFSVTPSVAETGTTVSSVTLNWSYAALSPTQQSINSVDIPVANRSVVLSGLNLTSATTFTLNALNGSKSASRSVTLAFNQRFFWGNSPNAHLTDVTGLSSGLQSNAAGDYSFSPATGNYKYLVIPSNYNISSIFDTVNRFDVTTDFEPPYALTISGQTYKVYRSTNPLNLGNWTIRVS